MAFSFSNLAGSESIAVMGVINLSPDSFYSRSSLSSTSEVLHAAEKMIHEGAHILDVGAESTRPGSRGISVKLELERLLPVITKLTKEFNVPISVDTYKPDVATVVLQEGANVINDISGLRFGDEMAQVVARYNAGIILMHMQGTPETMQDKPNYENVVLDVLNFLRESIKRAESAGIKPNNIAIDPGIGFGKNLSHNLELIGKLGNLKGLQKHIVLGVSRKSFIGQILQLEVNDRLEGSLAAGIVGIMNGANILRVHDVESTKRVVKVVHSIHEGI